MKETKATIEKYNTACVCEREGESETEREREKGRNDIERWTD